MLVIAGAAPAVETTIEARLTTTPPKLDGNLDDPAWAAAKPVFIPVLQVASEQRPGTTVVTLRAVRTASDIYFAARWADPTNSSKKEFWTFDGKKWSQDPNQDEDRFAMAFPINNSVPWFAQAGCTASCHSLLPPGATSEADLRYYMATKGPTERLDAWHWKSVRSNPLGYVDDKYWNDDLPAKGRKNAGRHYDARTPGPSSAGGNRAKDRKSPAFMQDPKRKPSLPGTLLRAEAVPFDPAGFKAGDTVPGRILSKPGGSQGDIACVGKWRENAWHLEIRRALNTGHDDDVVFRSGDRMPFSLAIFDNVSELRKQDHGKCVDLQWLVLPKD